MTSKKHYQDPRGGHVRIYWEIIDSNAWKALSWADQALYVVLRRRLKATNNGDIEATLAGLRHYGVSSSATLAKGLRALIAVGLIKKTRSGMFSQGSRTCNLYGFTDEPINEFPGKEIHAQPATGDWKRFSTIAQAKAAIREAHRAAKTGKARPIRKNAKPIQSQNINRSGTELATKKNSSVSEGGNVIQFKPRTKK